MFGDKRQFVQSPMHRQKRGIQNVYLVNFVIVNNTNRPRHRIVLDLSAELFPFFIAQLLGIIQISIVVIWRKNHCCGLHRTSKTTPSGLITASFNTIFRKKRFEHRYSDFFFSRTKISYLVIAQNTHLSPYIPNAM